MSALQHLLAGLRWRDVVTTVVDIAIVYFVIYRALLLIRGARAAQALIGLVVMGGAFFLAKQFDLMTVSWLLDNFASYGILLVIIIFQNDIRRALLRIGRNLFGPTRAYAETHVLEEVVEAATHLAHSRVGALIVLEREADLSELIEAGIEVDAQVSRELLMALFGPSSQNAMRDGAAILKNSRIAQAGAVLPLSAHPTLDPSLGARHRAAVGISEQTDAVVIVVSQEHGRVSLCVQGEITSDLDGPALREALFRQLRRDRSERRERRAGPTGPTAAPFEPRAAPPPAARDIAHS